MRIMGLGLDYAGKFLFPAMDDQQVLSSLVSAMERNSQRVRALAITTQEAIVFRGEIRREAIDLGNPREAGWTYLVNAADPHREDIARILEPLAKHRGMSDAAGPLVYNGEPPDEWFTWLNENYYSLTLEEEKTPQYVLIVGGPEQVPFLFQSVLDTAAGVGRVAFDNLEDLEHYVAKLIRIETQDEPRVRKEATFFAPDPGLPDPTYFSRLYMVEPLVKHIRDDLGFEIRALTRNEATKGNLLNLLSAGNPALVYTASHGLGAVKESSDIQRRYNGAICCQHVGPQTMDDLFTAEDVPLDRPFLEGAVFFQFACFGYGTPAQSDYGHWLNDKVENYTDTDFIAALPKKLLAHPKGPIAYIGHLDTAFLHGFSDAESPHILDRWHARIAPFKTCLDHLLAVQPSGLAMNDMNTRYSICNALITNTYDRQKRGTLKWNDKLKARFLDNWITRGDAQNYMIFGDPAAHLHISA